MFGKDDRFWVFVTFERMQIDIFQIFVAEFNS